MNNKCARGVRKKNQSWLHTQKRTSAPLRDARSAKRRSETFKYHNKRNCSNEDDEEAITKNCNNNNRPSDVRMDGRTTKRVNERTDENPNGIEN